MWPDQILNLGPLTLESDALPTALHSPAVVITVFKKGFSISLRDPKIVNQLCEILCKIFVPKQSQKSRS